MIDDLYFMMIRDKTADHAANSKSRCAEAVKLYPTSSKRNLKKPTTQFYRILVLILRLLRISSAKVNN